MGIENLQLSKRENAENYGNIDTCLWRASQDNFVVVEQVELI